MTCRLWLATLLFFSVSCAVHGADWQLDAATSHLEFTATFEQTAARGTFKTFDVRMRFDAKAPEAGRLDVSIAVNSADMNSSDINKAIAGPEWFDFAKFPSGAFHAAEFQRIKADQFLAHGILNLKGVQQAVDVAFTWSETSDAARMEGTFTVKRSAFGIGTGEWASTSVIGSDVTVKFDVNLHKIG